MRKPVVWLQLVILLLPVALFILFAWRARAVVDDAYINFRIVNHVLAGHGPVYNVGERVEAGTSPGWLAVLVVLAAVAGGGPDRLPWLSVYAGIAAGAIALMLAQTTAVRAWRQSGSPARAGPLVPAGVWIAVAVPPFAEFVASGLETGLVLLWIAGAAAAVGGVNPSARRGWRAAIVGLGPLVRPELALMAVPLIGALLLDAPRRLRTCLRVLVAAAVAPLGVQVLRMGYFAALVPNTALAKEAFESYWARGGAYLLDWWSRCCP
jgi:arabinofuranosyltransferase